MFGFSLLVDDRVDSYLCGQMGNLTKESFIRVLRRQSTGFSRGTSKFRGMGLQKCGQRDARMGEFLGNK